MVFIDAMYRRPKFLDVLLDIRSAMSAEAGNDIPAFMDMIRTGRSGPARPRTVTRVDGSLIDEAVSAPVVDVPPSRVVK